MLLSSLFVAAVLAAEPAAKPPLKLAAPGLQYTGLTKETGQTYSDHFAQQLALNGVVVQTTADVQALLGYERQNQLLGCSDESCVSQFASQLGVDVLLLGSIAKVQSGYLVNLKAVATKDGRQLSTLSVSPKSEDELIDTLNRSAKVMASELFSTLDRAPVLSKAQLALEAGKVRRMSWIPAVAGVVAAGAGAFLAVDARTRLTTLSSHGNLGGVTPEVYAADGRNRELAGDVLLGVGGAALVAGGLMFLLGGAPAETDAAPPPAKVTVAPTLGGAALVVGGTF